MLTTLLVACGPVPETRPESPSEAPAETKLEPPPSAPAPIDETAPPEERAEAHYSRGLELARAGELEAATAQLERAAELYDDPAAAAVVLNELSDVFFRRGDFAAQEEVLWRALEQAAEAGDPAPSAISWNNLGVSYAARGQPSAALAAYHRCLELRRSLDDEVGVATTRHNLGVQQLLLGRIEAGVEELTQALVSRRRLGNDANTGRTLASLAWGHALAGRSSDALAVYEEAVTLLERAGEVHDLAVALEQRSQLHRRRKDLAAARAGLLASRELLEASGASSPLDAAYLDLGLGAVERELAGADDPEGAAAAVARLRRAADRFDSLGALEGQVLARYELARALRAPPDQKADVEPAVRPLEEALDLIEAARADLQLPSFRATFLGGWQAVYQELVDVLASASWAASKEGRFVEAEELAGRALEIAERGRARALLDRLASSAGSPTTAWRELAGKKGELVSTVPVEELRGEVEVLETEALRSTTADDSGRGGEATAVATRAELRRARFAFERALEVMAEPTPVATPAGVDAIRRQLQGSSEDDGAILLVYALGPRRSWLWRLDGASLSVHPLPPGLELEAAARAVAQLLPRSGQLGYRRQAEAALVRLARHLLGPVAASLPEGRLAVVPDGALHRIPFAALPLVTDPASADDPSASAATLGEGREVVHLPSASTLVELRRRGTRSPASRLLAVVADPVFTRDDPRLDAALPAAPESAAGTAPSAEGPFVRLPASAEEAEGIAALARRSGAGEVPIHLAFEARRELVTGGGLDGFRILHFATHGLVDDRDPALTGLVLSLYDSAGHPRDGLLRARDLHDLHLTADLVVLSACRSGLGEEVRGEGLVGLADGFFAAGASHLVVSLWDVGDRATAELMTRFYHHLLLDRLRPGDALRQAQLELRRQPEWQTPSRWAAFVAVGDWRVGPFVSGAVE